MYMYVYVRQMTLRKQEQCTLVESGHRSRWVVRSAAGQEGEAPQRLLPAATARPGRARRRGEAEAAVRDVHHAVAAQAAADAARI